MLVLSLSRFLMFLVGPSHVMVRVVDELVVLEPPDGDWLRVRSGGLVGWVKRKNVYYKAAGSGGGGSG